MNQILVDTLGMWQFCFLALQDWAIEEGYKWPSEAYISSNVASYYIFEFNKDTVRGDHCFKDGKHIIRIKVGLKNELITWAHEFAHLIQRYNLGEDFTKLYDAQQSSVGYNNNIYECQARRAGTFTDSLYKRRLLHWYYNMHWTKKGTHSKWPKPKERTSFGGMMSYRDEIKYEQLNKHELFLLRQAWKTNRWLHEQAAKRMMKGAYHV